MWRLGMYVLLAVITTFAFSCQFDTQHSDDAMAPMDRLPQNQAGEIVRKSIEHSGGWEAWDQIKTLSFYKNIIHLDSTGQVARSQKQLHQYQLKPQFKAHMSWEAKGNQYDIINNGEQAKKYENGKEMTDEDSRNQAWNSSFGSYYVVSMPFKLTDPGVILTYDGIDSTTLHKPVHSVRVEYEKGAGSSGGMHTWWYYFDVSNYELVANFLDYGNGYSLTTYEAFASLADIRINQKRISYLADAQKNKVQKETIYENDSIKINESFKESLFQLK